MRRLLLFSGLLLSPPLTALAQEVPRAELFGGYTLARIGGETWGKGWNASMAKIITDNLAIVGDFSGYYKSASIHVLDVNFSSSGKVHNFLFGPQYSYRAYEKCIPFAHALFGATRISASGAVSVGDSDVSGSASETGFGMALGGGIDLKVKPHLAIRAAQLDYFMARKEGTTNGFRLSFGVVYLAGSR